MCSAATVLASLRQDEATARDAVLDNRPAPYDEPEQGLDSDSPLFDAFLEQGGSEGIVTLTNFTVSEFYLLYGHVEEVLVGQWTCGRGKKSKTKPMDAFLMMLCVLKHYSTWHKHALDFGFKPPTFEKLVHRVMDICEPVLRKAFVTTPTMSDHRGNGNVFTNYPYALYAVDVKFQPVLRPSGRFEEARRYFSNKHKLYGFKVEASVGPHGEVVFFTNHTAGAVSETTILSNHMDKHRELMRKPANESLLDDHGEGAADYQDSWALLADKGYQGAASMLRAVHPKKKPRNGELTADDVTRNTRVSSDRIIVENFFGRVCSLWRIMYATFKWNESAFDKVCSLCFVMTNFHARINPLRSDDGDFYRSVAAKYPSMAEERRTRRAETQRAYRRRRDARLNVDRSVRPRLSYVG